jgi:hypothetical protein
MGASPIGATQGDVIVQAPEMFEHVLEGIRDSLLEGAVALPLCSHEGTEQSPVLFCILGHVILPASVNAGSANQWP